MERTRDKKRTTSSQESMRDRVRKRAEEREQKGGGGTKFNFPAGKDIKFFQIKKGTMNIDILPYKVSVANHPEVAAGELWYQRTVYAHYNVGIEENAYICLKTIKHKCPICEEYTRLSKDPNVDEKVVKALKPKERELYNVIDLGDESAGVQLWDISYYLFGQKLEEEIKEGKEEWAGFADLVGGCSLRVRFAEESFGGNSFFKTSRIDFEPREDYPDSILEKAIDFDAILNILPYEKLQSIFMGVEDDVPPAGAKNKEEKVQGTGEGKAPLPAEEGHRTRPHRGTEREAEKCPHGGQFGIDTDELDACESCKIWEACADHKDALKAGTRK